MGGRLVGKRAFVTAAGKGIGRAVAVAFAAEEAEVIATDIDEQCLAEIAGGRITTRRLDVLDASAITRVAAETGAIDVLVNCAGYVHQNTIETCSEEDWSFAFDLNVRSAFRVTKAFLPGMLEKGGGSIIVISSAASSIKGVPNRFVYATTKAALLGFVKSIATDYVRRGIRANAICPGTIDTPSLADRIAANAAEAGSVEAARAAFVARQAMGRLGRPEEVAALAVYLAADESAFLTGQAIVIDGGWTL